MDLKEFSTAYLDVLRGTFSGLNLLGPAQENPEDFFIKQVKEPIVGIQSSSEISSLFERFDLCLDVGFGGGFPLLPLAITYPTKRFLGFEARQKKVQAVSTIAQRLSIPNVATFHQRVEEVLIDRSCLITFKAVGTCYDMLRKIHISPKVSDSYVIFYKGPQVFELEEKELSKIVGWTLVHKHFYELEGTEGRYMLCFKKDLALNSSKTLQNLVNLSSFL